MRIELPSGTPAELALPEGPPRRAVVLYPDIFGLRPLFDDLAAELAQTYDWAVCVVEPFAGQDLPDIEARFVAVAELDDARLIADGRDAADVVTQRTKCARVAVMGFCMGGMYAYKAAASGVFDRGVSFYGMIHLPVAWKGPAQGDPLRALREGSDVPVLAIVGDNDPYTPAEDLGELRALGPRITVVNYAGAEHGFVHDPKRPAHRAADAADAWARVSAWLA